MTDNFYAPPHSIEESRRLLVDCFWMMTAGARPESSGDAEADSFYSRPHTKPFRRNNQNAPGSKRPADGLTLFDELSVTVNGVCWRFCYIAEIRKRTRRAPQTSLPMQCRFAKPQWERYAINRMTGDELLIPATEQTATQKYEAIQAIFTQLTDQKPDRVAAFAHLVRSWKTKKDLRSDLTQVRRTTRNEHRIPPLGYRMPSPKEVVKASFLSLALALDGEKRRYSQMGKSTAQHEKKSQL